MKRKERVLVNTRGAAYDTSPHKSNIIPVEDIEDFSVVMFHAKNDGNQAVSIQYEGSMSGLEGSAAAAHTEFEKNLVNIGSAVTVVAQADGTNNPCSVETTTRRFPFYRCTYTYSVAPTDAPAKNLVITLSAQ